MNRDMRIHVRNKARLAKGIGNIIKEDTVQLYDDLDDLASIILEEDIYEIKRSSQWLIDTLSELEHYLYLIRRDG